MAGVNITQWKVGALNVNYPVSFYFYAKSGKHTLRDGPLRAVANRLLAECDGVSVDPFAGWTPLTTFSNDLNRKAPTTHHGDARKFITTLRARGVRAKLVILDPPYSPTQTLQCYRAMRKKPTRADTQNARVMKEVRDLVREIAAPGCLVISFGWNSCGMGVAATRLEHHQVRHGGARNDTICVVDQLN